MAVAAERRNRFDLRTIAMTCWTLGLIVIPSPPGLAGEPDRSGSMTRWYDARELEVEGKGWTETESFFDRFPAKAEGVVRPSGA